MMLESQAKRHGPEGTGQKSLRLIFFFLAIFTCNLQPATRNLFAQTVSSIELIDNAKQLDGKTVTYEGEVIGDIMVRGDFAWINVNDGKNAVGIWLNKEFIKDILYAGGYQVKGDTVRVVGIFSRACLQHGGDLDIHATGLHKISPGEPKQERVDYYKRSCVLWLLGVLCIVLILKRLKPALARKSKR